MLLRFAADVAAHDPRGFAAAAVLDAGQRAVGVGPDQQVGLHGRDAGTARQQVRVVARPKHDGIAADIQRIFTVHRDMHAPRDHVMKGNHRRGVGQMGRAILRTDA